MSRPILTSAGILGSLSPNCVQERLEDPLKLKDIHPLTLGEALIYIVGLLRSIKQSVYIQETSVWVFKSRVGTGFGTMW